MHYHPAFPRSHSNNCADEGVALVRDVESVPICCLARVFSEEESMYLFSFLKFIFCPVYERSLLKTTSDSNNETHR